VCLPGTSDGLIERKELDTDVIELIKRILRLKSIDRARGTSPAESRSSEPKQRPERVATTLGVSGESARRGVSSNEIKQPIWINEDAEYCKHLARFFKGK
tara:strand:+ start:215 stop:514 length:300 start_codon:yes stop_codon:yes gene_type:complete